jgi:hypothetical protein
MATCLAVVVLLARMNMAMFHEGLGVPLWTCLLHDHGGLLASPAIGAWCWPTIPWNHELSLTCIMTPGITNTDLHR